MHTYICVCACERVGVCVFPLFRYLSRKRLQPSSHIYIHTLTSVLCCRHCGSYSSLQPACCYSIVLPGKGCCCCCCCCWRWKKAYYRYFLASPTSTGNLNVSATLLPSTVTSNSASRSKLFSEQTMAGVCILSRKRSMR